MQTDAPCQHTVLAELTIQLHIDVHMHVHTSKLGRNLVLRRACPTDCHNCRYAPLQIWNVDLE